GEAVHLPRLLDSHPPGYRTSGGVVGQSPLWRSRRTGRAQALAHQLLDVTNLPVSLTSPAGSLRLGGMTFDPASFVFTAQDAPSAIRASTVLPARRENVEFTTEDGKLLLRELALPESGG